jgi:CDP-glucose 4,6-dehydratase
LLKHDFRVDIRDIGKIRNSLNGHKFDVVIHLAAQALVIDSYTDPIETFNTNVMGTLNIIKVTEEIVQPKFSLIITSDKVYKNKSLQRGYTEDDELGGDDPYSASKAAADIAAQSYLRNFANHPWAIARAGNVIGGGDWSANRLMPDIVRAKIKKGSIELRYPSAIRPWQHVMDCLNGYIELVDYKLNAGSGEIWNFGPELNLTMTVEEVTHAFLNSWGDGDTEVVVIPSEFHESQLLLLDSSRSRSTLHWSDKLDLHNTLELTATFYKTMLNNDVDRILNQQISDFYN